MLCMQIMQLRLKNILLEIKLPPNLPQYWPTKKTTWVLTNLISNAIRYSYENATVVIAVKIKMSIIVCNKRLRSRNYLNTKTKYSTAISVFGSKKERYRTSASVKSL